MAEFMARPGELTGFAENINQYKVSLGSYSSTIYSIKSSLSYDVQSRLNIASALANAADNISSEKKAMGKISSSLATIANIYVAAEQNVIDNGTGKGKTENPNRPKITTIYNTRPAVATADESEKGIDWIKYLKKIGKGALDVLGKFGTYGKMGALPIALLKNIIDNDGITGKDIGSTIKGMGNSIIGLCDEYDKTAGKWPLTTEDIKNLAGIVPYKTITAASEGAGWVERLGCAGKTYLDTLKSEASPIVTKELADGTLVKDGVKTGTKVAGWALSLIANGFSNYDEYSKGDISAERACAETVTETLVDIGKQAVIAAGVAAGCAAIGVAAPAVVVGGIGVGVTVVADIVCEQITGKSVTETTSDFILDTASAVGEKISGATKASGQVISDWYDKAIFSSGTPEYVGA